MRALGVADTDIARWDELLKNEECDEIRREMSYAWFWIHEQLAGMDLPLQRLQDIEFAFGQRVSASTEWMYRPMDREEGSLHGVFEFQGITLNRRHHINNIWMLAELVSDKAKQGVFDTPGEDLAMALCLEFPANLVQMRRAIIDARADFTSEN